MDKRAIKVLRNTIETAWKEEPRTYFYWDTYMKYISEENFAYAKEQSVMFDREQIGHNGIVERIKTAVSNISKQDVVNAFIFSLSTRQLAYRSFLSSYCIGKSLMAHNFSASPAANETICEVCGLHTFEFEEAIDFNTINYFKYKHGSCFTNLIQILFDLEQFPKFPKAEPKTDDFEILNQIKITIEKSAENDRPAQLRKNISKIIKSNDEERLGIIEILGVIAILHDDTHFGYADSYITYPEREHRPIRNDDVGYPARWWQGKFGIDNEKWNYWFVDKK